MKKIIRRILSFLGITKKTNLFESRESVSSFLSRLIPLEANLKRIGNKNDGGYLIPEDIQIDTVFSPGVFDDDSFECYFANQGIQCHLLDYSVESNPTQHRNITFEKKYLGYAELDNFINFDDWVQLKNFNFKGNFLLQMDIEGWEYNNLINVSHETLKSFSVLIIEFHDFDNIIYRHVLKYYELIFSKLLLQFDIVHLHPNNACGFKKIEDLVVPNTIEITFVRKGLITTSKKVAKIKNKLDAPNYYSIEDISIESWLVN
jgi:hypothetical protein